MSSAETEKTDKSTSKWDNESHEKLCVALCEAIIASKSSAAQHKDLIMAIMTAHNPTFTWEAVRYV
ncbi:hypothetical protein SEUCBS139899_000377 [Sporothrix eucalyptigena]|uniref:Uncharacterized protein n=1 Tax=Sporothrix eucalyptigena TaxID=1812306 RepID=A0ABP0BD96_9PEZI